MIMSDKEFQLLKKTYEIVGNDEALCEAIDTAVKVAPTDLSVLIQGESGVGKEVIPRIIHDYSPRKHNRGSYIAINCGSIPEGTIDSELFGHEKGAFTNAIGEHKGYFEVANNGTLFLDEVGELPMSTQARLLRVLETGEYMRVGSSIAQKTNVRIVAATNVDIPNAIREGKFREDLYYRLCTINIKMPPLRERGNDVILLFKHFSMTTAAKYRIDMPLRLNAEAEVVMRSYKWPGNIRQLRNITEQMSILCEERTVTPQTLARYGIVPNSEHETGITVTSAHSSSSTHQHNYEKELQMLMHAVWELKNEVTLLKQRMDSSQDITPGTAISTPSIPTTMPIPSPTPAQTSTLPHTETPDPVEVDIQTAEEVIEDEPLNIIDMEKRNIIKALQRNHYRRKLAASELGISERTLFRKIKAYGIEK